MEGNIKTMKDIKFLQQRKGKLIKVFLMNGFQKKGAIREIGDDYIIFQEAGASGLDLIWKHAISTFSD